MICWKIKDFAGPVPPPGEYFNRLPATRSISGEAAEAVFGHGFNPDIS
jgi:hypothetical protein